MVSFAKLKKKSKQIKKDGDKVYFKYQDKANRPVYYRADKRDKKTINITRIKKEDIKK